MITVISKLPYHLRLRKYGFLSLQEGGKGLICSMFSRLLMDLLT